MKKILSLVLALSLIISVAPMSFATEAEETIDEPGMYFNFSAAAFGKDADIPATDIIENGLSETPEFATIGTDPWYIDGQRLVKDYVLSSAEPNATNYPDAKENALHWQVSKSYASNANNAGGTLVLRVKLNETGVFTPSITYEGCLESNRYSFFLAPVSAFTARKKGYSFYYNNSATDSNASLGDIYITNKAPLLGCYGTPNAKLIKLGQQQLWSETSTTKNVKFDPVEIKETGEYYLYLASNGREDNKPYSTVSTYKMNLYSIHFTPVPAKDLADKAFTAKEDSSNPPVNSTSIAAYTVCGNGTPEILETPDVTYGETCELEAPLTKEVGDKTYNFLYWARGLDASALNKKIVSCDSKFTYRPYEGVNYLIAVYEDADASTDKVEFYNGNGELMTDVELDAEGKLPEYPYMAGHGQATGWKLYQEDGNGEVYEAGEVAPESGTRIFVAQYDDPTEEIAISVNGVSDTYKYGDIVICESTDEKFSYWEKTINGNKQIVSIDKTYTFNAWEDCTVEAVCNGAFDLGRVARKILFGTFTVGNQTAVMAEFIGFGGAKEKGLVVGEKEIAMQSENNQFTITNDTVSDMTVSGYAIVDNSRYVDGEVTVAAPVVEEE